MSAYAWEANGLIEVSHLTKRYGAHTAVSDLSFTIEKGRIYGFLGPNGAGKSTTMNIIAGCLAASEGDVKIGGHDIFEEPLEAKRLIGYLPELPPLYTDMTPLEYLSFVARAKGVKSAEMKARIAAVIEKTKIDDVKRRLIKNLSKGYRQRVGIAQALIGNPEVIILDEPTVGLDPKQIIEIRELIRELGQDHTVILSSHILSEVSAICDEIMIISHGKLVASDTPDNLTRVFAGETTLKLTLKADSARARQALMGIAGVEQVRVSGEAQGRVSLEISQTPDADISESVFWACAEAKTPILEMALERASLEDVFLELTQDKENGDVAQPREEAQTEADDAQKEGEAS